MLQTERGGRVVVVLVEETPDAVSAHVARTELDAAPAADPLLGSRVGGRPTHGAGES